MRNCDYCHGLYNPIRVKSGDYRWQFCGALCQRYAGVLSERDILAAERNPLLTPEEIDELVARFRQERQELS